jgi:hypothetical protein
LTAQHPQRLHFWLSSRKICKYCAWSIWEFLIYHINRLGQFRRFFGCWSRLFLDYVQVNWRLFIDGFVKIRFFLGGFLSWLACVVIFFFQKWAEIGVVFVAIKNFPAIQVEVIKKNTEIQWSSYTACKVCNLISVKLIFLPKFPVLSQFRWFQNLLDCFWRFRRF